MRSLDFLLLLLVLGVCCSIIDARSFHEKLKAGKPHKQHLKTKRQAGQEPQVKAEEPNAADAEDDEDVNVEIKIRNKNGQDLWAVSRLLLQDGIQKSIVEALKQNLHLTNKEDINGIKKSIRKTFQHLQDEAVHVDDPAVDGSGPNRGELVLRFSSRDGGGMGMMRH